MRFIVRLIAFLLILVALAGIAAGVFLVVDGADLAQAGGRVWVEIDRQSLELTQVVLERYIAPVIFYPDVWFDLFVPLLALPAWQGVLIVIGAPGLLGLVLWRLAGIGRGRRATQADD